MFYQSLSNFFDRGKNHPPIDVKSLSVKINIMDTEFI